VPARVKSRVFSATKKLATYRRKRDFAKTSEPNAGGQVRRTGHLYLIQKHAARRLHYDFRLELDGVLKSWAVTKGPSLDPADRRLAVHVEDHPLAYGKFEGTIPQGQYGGGTVMLWDNGTWSAKGDARMDYARGRLHFTLNGDRLKGGWLLVRMGGRAQEKGHDNWLLIKERDDYAKPGKGDALLERAAKSVFSGKTMEQIAAAKSVKVWQSKSAGKAHKPGPAAKLVAVPKKPGLPDLARVEGARRAKLPDFVPPELATLVEKPPQGGRWLHEIKIDGYRTFVRREGSKVRLLTRTGQDWTDRFKALMPMLERLPGGDFALDGEVAVLDTRGVSSFGGLQKALSAGWDDKLVYIVFDLLYLDGYDLRNAALINRKRTLEKLLKTAPKNGPLRYSEHLDSSGGKVFRHACQLRLEGIISKRADRPYIEHRTQDWLKSKCITRQEFVICGYTPPKTPGRTGFGSLILGYYEEAELRYAGHVGTGFSQQQLSDLTAKLKALKTSRSSLANPNVEARRRAIWVKPKLVCEIEFLAWTSEGVLRHPSFQGLREDKAASMVTRDIAIPRQRSAAAGSRSAAKTSLRHKQSLMPADDTVHSVAGVVISHPDRDIFPGLGITKEQLAEYYASVAKWLLPEIEGRPLSLLRCPSGAQKECFFQKHFATGMKSIERVDIQEKRGAGEYLVAHTIHDVVAIVQEGVIEFHPWGSRADDPDGPDRMIFDFDPDSGLKFARVVDGALAMRGFLAKLGLESWPKTTGGKGLHVVVPLKRGIGWTDLKGFARAVASSFVEADPKTYTINPLKRERTGRIFIDYLRNDRGSTAVAGYCVRARPNAGVAMPLAWAALKSSLDPRQYSIETVPRLLRARREDPWRGLYKSRQTISAKALETFGLI
jgi:bifunctional non-homologous end joining protein LigD